MAGHAFVVAKEVFIMETVVFRHSDNGWITTNNSFGVNSAMPIIIFNHVKLRFIEPCNALIKRALVSQQSTLVAAKDPNISHYLDWSIYLQMIILAII